MTRATPSDERIHEVAIAAARAGGEIVARYFRDDASVQNPGMVAAEHGRESYNLVTEADLQSEQAIARVIRGAFPDHDVMGEESHRGDADAEHLWVIDPLDGTNNFAHGIDHFAVSVAYYHGGQPVSGVVFNPVRDHWYEAVRGRGATFNGESVSVCDDERLDQVLVATGFYYDRGAMMEATLAAIRDLFRRKIHGIRRFGTASLDLAAVGCGRLGAFFEFELAPWDFAAGRLIVEEAGGRVTTCAGNPLPLGNSSLLATNGRIHEAVLDIVGPRIPGG